MSRLDGVDLVLLSGPLFSSFELLLCFSSLLFTDTKLLFGQLFSFCFVFCLFQVRRPYELKQQRFIREQVFLKVSYVSSIDLPIQVSFLPGLCFLLSYHLFILVNCNGCVGQREAVPKKHGKEEEDEQGSNYAAGSTTRRNQNLCHNAIQSCS